MQIAFIGIGAGAAAALLFASMSSGSWLSVALFYLAPLPIMIAGIGWSHWAALIAALSGALALGAAFSSVFFLAFLTSAGLPAWWLSYLAMLARPAVAGSVAAPPGTSLEWYPPGRLLLWAALLAAGMVVIAIPALGLTAETFHAALSEKLTDLLRTQTGTIAGAPLTLPGVSDPAQLIDFLANAIPPTAAVIATITNATNLWLAARVVTFSGRLRRPWPVLADMRVPRPAAAALVIAVVLSFVGGLVGLAAGIVGASLLMAFGLLGFAVLHAVTQGMQARGFLLGGAYAAVFVLGWPILALALLGFIDTIFDLRARIARKRARAISDHQRN